MGQEWGGEWGPVPSSWAVSGPAVGRGPASLFTLSQEGPPRMSSAVRQALPDPRWSTVSPSASLLNFKKEWLYELTGVLQNLYVGARPDTGNVTDVWR